MAATGSWQAIIRGAGHTQFLTAGEQTLLLPSLVSAIWRAQPGGRCRGSHLHSGHSHVQPWSCTVHCGPTGRLLDPALRLLCGGGSSSSKQVVRWWLVEG